MLSYVLATIRDTNELLGYRILTIANGMSETNDIPKDKFIEICRNNSDIKFQNAIFDYAKNELLGSGANISTLPIISSNGVLRTQGGLTLLYSITKNGDIVGYGVSDSYGMVVNIETKKLLRLTNAYKKTNFEVYTKKDGNLGFRLKSGNIPKIEMTKAIDVKSYNSKIDSADVIEEAKKSAIPLVANVKNVAKANQNVGLVSQAHKNNLSSELKSSGSDNALPGLHVYNLNDVSESEFNNDCQDKLYIMSLNLSALTPYYSLMYQSIPKQPVTAIPTMAVTEDELFYNTGFVHSLTVPELTFVVIHEMLHIAMQHSIRHGKRNNELWNIACDLFINEIIIRDFGCKFGGDSVSFNDATNQGRKPEIKVPPYGVFLATIGETLDFGVDTPEAIYERLLKENPNFNMKGSGNNSNGSINIGSSKLPSDGDGKAEQTSNGSETSGNSSESDGSSNNNNNNNGNSEKNPFGGENKSDSGSSTINVEIVDSDNGEYNAQLVDVDVVYNGKHIKGQIPMDVASNNELKASQEDVKKSVDESQMALRRIVTKRKMAESQGKSCSITSSGEVCERYIRFGLSAKYDWVQILKNVAKVDPKKMYTLAQPNKQYMMRGITLAARREIGKPEKLRGIKFAMDVSGSVGQREMDSTFTKIGEILNLYKIDAELIYWDTTVNSVGNFSDLKGLAKIKPLGCGGTDLTCVFDYLMGKTRCNGVAEDTKLKDISVVMIFTDGAFCLRNPEYYKKYFANKVVFIANDGCPPFDIPFGKLAVVHK